MDPENIVIWSDLNHNEMKKKEKGEEKDKRKKRGWNNELLKLLSHCPRMPLPQDGHSSWHVTTSLIECFFSYNILPSNISILKIKLLWFNVKFNNVLKYLDIKIFCHFLIISSIICWLKKTRFNKYLLHRGHHSVNIKQVSQEIYYVIGKIILYMCSK